MRIRSFANYSGREDGSALMIMLVTVSLVGITLASYLGMVSSQNRSTMRSQQWNSAIPIIEAGIEEALTHLYYNPENRGGNGWTLVGTNYTKERMLGDSKYIVTISDSSPPVIVSRAYVKAPLSTNYMIPPRAVRVTTFADGSNFRGMVAKDTIDLSGNNISTDSFDSSNPTYSTGGRYDPAKRKDGGFVGTNSRLTNTFNIGNADIHGKASTGPGGRPSIGPNGGIGPKWWRDQGNKGIYNDWFTADLNISFPEVKEPFNGGGFTPSSGKVGGTNYTYVLSGGNYQMSSLSMSSKQILLVNGNSTLYVTGNVALSGQSSIVIAPGSSLKLYVGGSSASLAGNGVINQNANATNFWYYGLTNNTSLTLSGNAAFTGVIYAPNANFQLGGGGNNTYDFVGASVTGNVKMNGHFNFHYDESLGRLQSDRGFVVNSWNEIAWTGP